jgi:hypothetical protein
MTYLTISEFLAMYPSFTNTGYDVVIVDLLEKFSETINQESRTTFVNPLPTKTKRWFGSVQGTNYFNIGGWQALNLEVKQGSFGDTTLKTLVLDTDYYLVTPFGLDSPIVRIELPNIYFYKQDFLEITGTFGWSIGLPAKLKQMLAYAVIGALSYMITTGKNAANGQSQGIATRIKSLNFEKEFGISPEYLAQSQALATGNLMAVKSIYSELYKYRIYTENYGL